MNPIVRTGVAMFVVGLLTGAAASWHAARWLERFRRDRQDLRLTVDQAKGLAGKVRAQLVAVAKVAGWTLVALVALVLVAASR